MFNLQNFLLNLTTECDNVSLPVSFIGAENVMNFDLVNDAQISIIKMIGLPNIRRISFSLCGSTKSGAIFTIEADFHEYFCDLDLFQKVSFVDMSEVSIDDFSEVKLFAQAFEFATRAIHLDEVSFLCTNEYDIGDHAFNLLFHDDEEVV